MLGASAGVQDQAFGTYQKWCELAGYEPKIYLDIELPPPTAELSEGTGEYEGCKLYNNVVIYRSNGSPTYAAHDLAFAELESPDFYLTGAEQREHFQSLGLGEKHLPLGLVLGADGKKMRSTVKKEGEIANALAAQELFDLVLGCMEPSPEPEKLAWNILAWQFNSAQVSTNTKFVPQDWAKPEAPGLYCTYTLARIGKALGEKVRHIESSFPEVEEKDLPLLVLSQQIHYYIQKAQETKEPHHVANYALQLSRMLSNRYKAESIKDGSKSYQYAIREGYLALKTAMETTGMHPLETV